MDPFRRLYDEVLKHAEWELAEYEAERLRLRQNHKDVTEFAMRAAKVHVQHLREMISYYEDAYDKAPLR